MEATSCTQTFWIVVGVNNCCVACIVAISVVITLGVAQTIDSVAAPQVYLLSTYEAQENKVCL